MSLLPYSTLKKAPYFYIDGNGNISDETWSILTSGHFQTLFLLGSEDTFPDKMIDSLKSDGISATRVCDISASVANKNINASIVMPALAEQNKHIDTLIVSSTWHPFDSFNIGRYTIENNAAMLLVDSNNLDSVACAIQYLKGLNGSVSHLVFVGDDNQFNRIDKRLLIKAVQQAK